MSTYKLMIAKDQNDLARLCCEVIASSIDLVLDQRDRCQISLSGGSTPEETYRRLAKEHLPWDRVDVFLGDERWVAVTDERSNAKMLRRTLLESGPGSEAKFFPIPTVELSSPEESANNFSTILQEHCLGEPPIFDLILLGLGDDGHTASLFPYTDSLKVSNQYVTSCLGKGMERVTITTPVINSARKVIFIVSGASKKLALERLRDVSESTERTPARLVQPKTEILILTDKSTVE